MITGAAIERPTSPDPAGIDEFSRHRRIQEDELWNAMTALTG
jgi:hypothetical protein